MEKEAIKYVATNKEGDICGPTADTKEDLIDILCHSHWRIGLSGKWEDIEKEGYTIHKAKITIIQGET